MIVKKYNYPPLNKNFFKIKNLIKDNTYSKDI